MFHEHKQLSDDELKMRLKTKLDDDDYCVNQLQKLKDNGVLFDDLWETKLYSAVSILIALFVSYHILYRILTSNLFEYI